MSYNITFKIIRRYIVFCVNEIRIYNNSHWANTNKVSGGKQGDKKLMIEGFSDTRKRKAPRGTRRLSFFILDGYRTHFLEFIINFPLCEHQTTPKQHDTHLPNKFKHLWLRYFRDAFMLHQTYEHTHNIYMVWCHKLRIIIW